MVYVGLWSGRWVKNGGGLPCIMLLFLHFYLLVYKSAKLYGGLCDATCGSWVVPCHGTLAGLVTGTLDAGSLCHLGKSPPT